MKLTTSGNRPLGLSSHKLEDGGSNPKEGVDLMIWDFGQKNSSI
jgi:hypothetical protein